MMKKLAWIKILLASIFLVSNLSIGWAGMESGKKPGRENGTYVTNVIPGDLSSEISTRSPLTVEFGGNVSPSFYQTVNITLFQGARQIEGDLFCNQNSKQVMFKPRIPLEDGMTYTAQLNFGSAEQPGEKVWSFRTKGKGSIQDGLSNKSSGESGVMVAGMGATAGQTSQPLTIMNANMAQGALNPDSPLEITFSEPLEVGSLRDAPIQVQKSGQQVGIDYRLSKDLKTISLVPRSPLKKGSDYRILITSTLAGTSGSKLLKNTAIPFSIGGGADNSQTSFDVAPNVLDESPAPSGPSMNNRQSMISDPSGGMVNLQRRAPVAVGEDAELKVVGLSPRANETISNLSSPVVVAFKGQIRPETINEFTFRLEDEFGPVPAKIRFIPGQNQAILTPSGVLDSGKNYRVIVTQGITDAYGRQLSKGITSSFNTTSPSASPSFAPANPEYEQAQAPRPNPFQGRAQGQTRQISMDTGNSQDFEQAEAPRANPFLSRGRSAPKSVSMDIASAQDFEQAEPVRPNPIKRKARGATKSASMDVGSDLKDLEGGEDSMTAANPDPEFAAQAAPQDDPSDRQRSKSRQRSLSEFKVVGIRPAANSYKVTRDSPIVVQFSEDVSPSTVNNISFSVFGNSVRVEGLVTYDSAGKQAVFVPSKQLDLGTQYKVLLSDKIRSRNGENLASKYTWEFTTVPEQHRVYQPMAYGGGGGNPSSSGNASKKRIGIRTVRSTDANGFVFLPEKHWAFKTIQMITQKGLLGTYPFKGGMRVSRYEMAMAINSALGNIKSIGSTQTTAKLKSRDLADIEKLIIEFRSELRSTGIDTQWFERFIEKQGIQVSEIESSMSAG
ncbi:MAG: Ig-like domain-containing protein [Candidatus Riflebacteria bacterium]|nr:Ig-like domain-containing protein [Candidatus Riflebacteria bacterium]